MKKAWVWLFLLATVAWVDAFAADPSKSVGTLAKSAATDLMSATGLIAVLFYVVGAVLVGVGLLKIKRHSDQPQQVTLGSGFMWIIIGVALIVAPFIIDAVATTFGTTTGGSGPNIKPPKLTDSISSDG